MSKLEAENQDLNTENAALRKSNGEIEENVAKIVQRLQEQMTHALTVAVDKATKLEGELQESNERKEELESVLSDIQKKPIQGLKEVEEGLGGSLAI